LLDVAKQRNGPCGDIELQFLPAIVGFEVPTLKGMEDSEPNSQPMGTAQDLSHVELNSLE
jgi:hypothetical protein